MVFFLHEFHVILAFAERRKRANVAAEYNINRYYSKNNNWIERIPQFEYWRKRAAAGYLWTKEGADVLWKVPGEDSIYEQ